MLPMLYSATLLDPLPFDSLRFSAIGLTAVASCALAYLSSAQFKSDAEIDGLRLRQIIAKPPFVVWITVVVIIALHLASGLLLTGQ